MAENTAAGMGKLIIQTTTGRDTIPVEGVSVTVSSPSGQPGVPSTLLYSAQTDRSGLTPVFDLEAPPRADSMQPGGKAPYARYNVQVAHPDYQPVSIVDVTIFDGVVSTLPVFLVPSDGSAQEGNGLVEVIPPPPLS